MLNGFIFNCKAITDFKNFTTTEIAINTAAIKSFREITNTMHGVERTYCVIEFIDDTYLNMDCNYQDLFTEVTTITKPDIEEIE